MPVYDMYHDVSSTSLLIPRFIQTTQSYSILILFMLRSPNQFMTRITHAQVAHEYLLYASGASILGTVKSAFTHYHVSLLV